MKPYKCNINAELTDTYVELTDKGEIYLVQSNEETTGMLMEEDSGAPEGMTRTLVVSGLKDIQYRMYDSDFQMGTCIAWVITVDGSKFKKDGITLRHRLACMFDEDAFRNMYCMLTDCGMVVHEQHEIWAFQELLAHMWADGVVEENTVENIAFSN